MWTVIAIFALAVSVVITAYVVHRLTMRATKASTNVFAALTTETDWIKVGVFFVLMLIGMLAREAYNMLVHNRPFNWTSLAIAAVVSPIVFGGVYGSLGGLEIDPPSVILAFQNGFFWNSIFEGIQG
jgi:hypothetical protein